MDAHRPEPEEHWQNRQFDELHSQELNLFDVSNSTCSHIWDKDTGIKKEGKPWIGIKAKWIRTCNKCGRKEEFSKGIFNGWFEYCG